jgi:hypothetical protein
VAPEQAVGRPLDARADVYAFGVVAYRMVSGRLPPARIEELQPPLREEVDTTENELGALVMRCLAEPAQRPADGAALSRALASIRASDSGDPAESNASTGSGMKNGALLLAIGGPIAASAADELRALLAPLLREHRGRVVHQDSGRVLASFRSPTDAVRCGIALQNAISHSHAASPADVLRARVAVHLGEAVPTDASSLGESTPVIASVAERAAAGEVLLTGPVRLSINRAGLTLEPVAAVPLARGGRLPVYRCVPAAAEPGSDGGPRTLAALWRGAREAVRRLKRLAWR